MNVSEDSGQSQGEVGERVTASGDRTEARSNNMSTEEAASDSGLQSCRSANFNIFVASGPPTPAAWETILGPLLPELRRQSSNPSPVETLPDEHGEALQPEAEGRGSNVSPTKSANRVPTPLTPGNPVRPTKHSPCTGNLAKEMDQSALNSNGTSKAQQPPSKDFDASFAANIRNAFKSQKVAGKCDSRGNTSSKHHNQPDNDTHTKTTVSEARSKASVHSSSQTAPVPDKHDQSAADVDSSTRTGDQVPFGDSKLNGQGKEPVAQPASQPSLAGLMMLLEIQQALRDHGLELPADINDPSEENPESPAPFPDPSDVTPTRPEDIPVPPEVAPQPQDEVSDQSEESADSNFELKQG